MDIINKVIEFSKYECNRYAEEGFDRSSGLKNPKPQYVKMRNYAYKIRGEIDDRISIKAIYSYYENIRQNGNTITINHKDFSCNGFEQIVPDSIEGALVYMVTAGDYHFPGISLMDEALIDIWGTAYVDAGRNSLENYFKENYNLSDSFGPGFFGLDVANMQKLSELVDNEAIGIEIKESGTLIPIKSCAGIYFNVNEKYIPLDSYCACCYGNALSCKYCDLKRKSEIK